MNEQRELGDDILSILDFDFMPVGTELVGDKIKDTPIGESQQQDWMQMPPETRGPHLMPPSSPLAMVTYKVSVTPPPLSSEEHVQKESSLQEELEPRVTDEPPKETQVIECIQQPSQEVEDQTTGSTETKTIEEESSQ